MFKPFRVFQKVGANRMRRHINVITLNRKTDLLTSSFLQPCCVCTCALETIKTQTILFSAIIQKPMEKLYYMTLQNV